MGEPAKTPRATLRSRLMAYLGSTRGEFRYRIQKDVPLSNGANIHAADVAAAAEASLFGPQGIAEPALIVEVLDDQTERTVRYVKMFPYREMPSAQEILLVAANGRHVELYRRGGPHWFLDIFPSDGHRIRLTSVGAEIPLAELYDGIVFDDQLAV